MLIDRDDVVVHMYDGAFDYGRMREETWERVSRLIRFPSDEEIDDGYAHLFEDIGDEDIRMAVFGMLDRMDVERLDGRSGFVFMDTFGFVDMICEVGADGRSYCTASFPVDGALVIRPAT